MHRFAGDRPARSVTSAEIGGTTGAVVAIDVIRAFTTAACAFAAGAARLYVVADVDEALAFRAAHPGSVVMGEDGGRRPEGFDLPNSPARAAAADLDGRVVVQRTSAGTRGAVAAIGSADRLWCAALVTASATAADIAASGLGPPTYVLTGRVAATAERPARTGDDDRLTAEHIDALRRGERPDAAAVARAVAATDEVALTLALGADHVDPDDIAIATDVDRFDFTLVASLDADGLRLEPRVP